VTLRRVRRDLDAFSNTLPWVGPGLQGLCAVASLLIHQDLASKGLASTLVCSLVSPDSDLDGHCWVEYRKKILDVTSTQFGGPEVAVMSPQSLPAWAASIYTGGTFLFRGQAALEEISNWAPNPFHVLRAFHAYHSVSQPTV
jgi:hypothetical protein